MYKYEHYEGGGADPLVVWIPQNIGLVITPNNVMGGAARDAGFQ